MSGRRQAQSVSSPSLVSRRAPAAAAPGSPSSAASSSRGGARPQLRVLVQQQAEAPARPLEQARVVLRLARPPLERDQRGLGMALAHGLGGAVRRGVVEHEQLVRYPVGVRGGDGVEAGEQVVAAVRVDDAVGEQGHRCAASSSSSSTRPASRSRSNSRSASALALRPIAAASSGWSRSHSSFSARSRPSPART